MRSASPSTPWIHFWQTKPQARLRLFCFPYAGGGASIFRSFAEHMPSEVEVYPVQLPGRENRFAEPPFSRMDQLIEALEEALFPYLDVPYAFFGHSMGALISFELACSLRRNRQIPEPVHLFVSGHRAPHLPNPNPPIHQLSETHLLEELRRFNGTPKEVLKHAELLQVLLPLLRADFTLCETCAYTQKQPFTCPISAFGGLQDEHVPYESIQAWREHTHSTFKVHFFTGDHFFLQKQQAALLTALSQDLFHYLQS